MRTYGAAQTAQLSTEDLQLAASPQVEYVAGSSAIGDNQWLQEELDAMPWFTLDDMQHHLCLQDLVALDVPRKPHAGSCLDILPSCQAIVTLAKESNGACSGKVPPALLAQGLQEHVSDKVCWIPYHLPTTSKYILDNKSASWIVPTVHCVLQQQLIITA